MFPTQCVALLGGVGAVRLDPIQLSYAHMLNLRCRKVFD